jgi:hypothetical protein
MRWFRKVVRRPAPRDSVVNTVQDEQDRTTFRVLTDYVTSLAASWIANVRSFFAQVTGWFGILVVRRRKD